MAVSNWQKCALAFVLTFVLGLASTLHFSTTSTAEGCTGGGARGSQASPESGYRRKSAKVRRGLRRTGRSPTCARALDKMPRDRSGMVSRQAERNWHALELRKGVLAALHAEHRQGLSLSLRGISPI